MEKYQVKETDFLVVGCGVAGLRAAIELGSAGFTVLVISKDKIEESSSEYAQGGIAVALSEEDKISLHYDDTIAAGDGLCYENAVQVLVEEGPRYIQELIQWGTQFDREGSKLAFTREGAHSSRRILHAHGDSTGQEMVRSLLVKARSNPNIFFKDWTFVLDLLVSKNHRSSAQRCYGAILFNESGSTAGNGGSTTDKGEKSAPILSSKPFLIKAKAVILATGGAGQIYQHTTNPEVATGDGMALAYRAGAELMNLEFIQFHPTTLYRPGNPTFLLSEAMRGEGGKLIDQSGRRFVFDYHEKGELAPRDVVSRAILYQLKKNNEPCCYLDVRELGEEYLQQRFPRIWSTTQKLGLDISKELIPVRPSAHYFMGGVRTDLWGRTNLAGLYACGEVACTGVHGANRLASNSLLEGLVFGARAGQAAGLYAQNFPIINGALAEEEPIDLEISDKSTPAAVAPQANIEEALVKAKKLKAELSLIMENYAGIWRCKNSLNLALTKIQDAEFPFPELQQNQLFSKNRVNLDSELICNRFWQECRNLLDISKLIINHALIREESRGAHFREDFPSNDDLKFKKHLVSAINKQSYLLDLI